MWKQTQNSLIQKAPTCNISPIGDGAVKFHYVTTWGTSSDMWVIDQDGNAWIEDDPGDELGDVLTYDMEDLDAANAIAMVIVRQLIPMTDEEHRRVFMAWVEEATQPDYREKNK